MNEQEATDILTVIKAAYPNSFRDMKRKDAEAAIALWQRMFSETPAQVVQMAVEAYIATGKFAPSIAEINDLIQQLTAPQMMTGEEAWGQISRALKHSGDHSREEYDKLSPIIQRLIGSPSTLHEWALMDVSEVNTVVKSNFLRSYEARAKQQQFYNRLPEGIKALSAQIVQQHTLAAPDPEAARKRLCQELGDGEAS